MQFAVHIARQRNSVKVIRDVGARVVLPGHGNPTEDVAALSEANLEAIEHANRAVFAAVGGNLLAEILEKVCNIFALNMISLSSYVLN